MNRLALVCLVPVLAAGCATFEEATPPGYAGPTVEVTDTADAKTERLTLVFELLEIDGRRVSSSGIAMVAANRGRGSTQSPVVISRQVPAMPSKVKIGAATHYAAPILAMTQPTCQITGVVDFQPQSGKRYVVSGKVLPEVCAAWIADSETGTPVTAQVTGKGTR